MGVFIFHVCVSVPFVLRFHFCHNLYIESLLNGDRLSVLLVMTYWKE